MMYSACEKESISEKFSCLRKGDRQFSSNILALYVHASFTDIFVTNKFQEEILKSSFFLHERNRPVRWLKCIKFRSKHEKPFQNTSSRERISIKFRKHNSVSYFLLCEISICLINHPILTSVGKVFGKMFSATSD